MAEGRGVQTGEPLNGRQVRMISEEQIEQVTERLRLAAPDATIILFGSHARGDARESSDLDILVVEPQVTARRLEMVRLSDALRDLRVPTDILVVSRSSFDAWADEPCTVIHEAATHGRVLYEPARSH